jgi:hypothetical protein
MHPIDAAREVLLEYGLPAALRVHPDTRQELWRSLCDLRLEDGNPEADPPDDLRVWGVPTRPDDTVERGAFVPVGFWEAVAG